MNMLNFFLKLSDEIMLKQRMRNVRANILKKKNLREMRWSLKKTWGS